MAAPLGRGHAIAVTFRWMQSSRGPGPGREHLEGQDLDLDLFQVGHTEMDGIWPDRVHCGRWMDLEGYISGSGRI